MTQGGNWALIAVDDGFRDHKVAWFGQDGQIRTMSFPASARQGEATVTDLGGSSSEVSSYVTEGVSWQVGAVVNPVETRGDEYPTSALNRVLVHHAMWSAIETDVHFGAQALAVGVSVSTALPIGRFYTPQTGRIDESLRAAKQKNVLVSVQRRRDHEQIEVHKHRVFCQAVAAYLDYLLDDRCVSDSEREGERVAVVDIGGFTTDFLLIQRYLPDHAYVRSVKVGVLSGAEQLGQLIMERLKRQGTLSTNRLVQWFREAPATAQIMGSTVDIADLVDAARKVLRERLMQEIERTFGPIAMELDRLLLVGGGASLLDETQLKERFPQAVIPVDAAFSNVRGQLKYLQVSSVKAVA